MKALSVAGYSKTGKTTASTNIIRELSERGYCVNSIKDIHYEKFTMEKEGSDSWSMQQAGAKRVFARGLRETFMISPERMDIKEMIQYLMGDWLVVEGMKKEALPKVICAESMEQLAELVDENVFCISGKISDEIKEYQGIPVISSIKNTKDLVDLIEMRVFEVLPLNKEECCSACGMSCYKMVGAILKGRKRRSDCLPKRTESVLLKINGKEISIVPYVEKTFYDVVTAYLKNLKGYEKGKIEITLE